MKYDTPPLADALLRETFGRPRPEQVVYFFRQVLGVPVVSKEVLSQRTTDYQAWVEAFARNHDITPRQSTLRNPSTGRRR
jgi:hypothetical protein